MVSLDEQPQHIENTINKGNAGQPAVEAYLSPPMLAEINKRRIARIVQGIAIALLLAFTITILVSILNYNWAAVMAMLVAAPPIAATFWLVRRGHVSTAVFMMATVLLVMITALSTLGQGIHDVANIAYPGILVVSSLILNRRAFMLLAGLTIAAICWLVLGAMFGLFVPLPHSVGNLADLITVSLALSVTAFSAYSLANNMQRSLLQAQKETNERKLAEQALRESQAMLQLIFDHAFDGISVYEEYPELGTRRLIDCNTRYAEIAGRSRDELLAIGNTLLIQKDVGPLLDRQQFLERLEREVYVGRFSWLRPDGQDNVVEYAAVPLHLADRFLVIGVDRDITTQVHAAQERETLIKELGTKNSELERFTYTVSHDLKSPLITIGGFAGFLEKDAQAGDIERVKTDVARINEAVSRMQRLLGELLELSRIGRLMNPPEEVSFETIAREAVELVRGRIEERGVDVTIVPGLPTVYGDRARLVEVVQNLVDNACKFMGDQSQPCLDIGAKQSQGEIVFYVCDNGMGIEPQYHDKVFALFEKLDPQSEGTGIGLAIVKRIIETHGGKIWVESEGNGKGSTFYFTTDRHRKKQE
ncbi:MAG: PAS domain S-box protein [Anaerolineae bacterium]|nr:PAS domain S-box protein [Anaerolineae bacterium]